jgi:hypothetical protein
VDNKVKTKKQSIALLKFLQIGHTC